MFFRDVFGHTELKKRLIDNINSGRIAHAQLFCGPEGTGKLPLAIAYARYLSCTNKGVDDACGVCPSCVKFNRLSHPDLHFILPTCRRDNNDKRLSVDHLEMFRELVNRGGYFNVDQWKETEFGDDNKTLVIYNEEGNYIVEHLQKKSFEAEYKMVIIWHPELMNLQCANRILKNIEEPIGKTVFILVSDYPDGILGTILSRVQRVVVPALSDEEVENVLRSLPESENIDVKGIVRVSCGNLIMANRLISEDSSEKQFLNLFILLTRAAFAGDLRKIVDWHKEITKFNKKEVLSFLSYCQRLLRENFIMNLNDERTVYMTTEETNFCQKFSPYVNEQNVWQLIDEFGKAEFHISRNCVIKIVLYDLAIKLIMLLKTI